DFTGLLQRGVNNRLRLGQRDVGHLRLLTYTSGRLSGSLRFGQTVAPRPPSDRVPPSMRPIPARRVPPNVPSSYAGFGASCPLPGRPVLTSRYVRPSLVDIGLHNRCTEAERVGPVRIAARRFVRLRPSSPAIVFYGCRTRPCPMRRIT